MTTFLKVQAASILGSAADYLTTIILVEIFNCWYLIANFAGNICGGAAQFLLCRNWAFGGGNSKVQIQIMKFVIVFAGISYSPQPAFTFSHICSPDQLSRIKNHYFCFAGRQLQLYHAEEICFQMNGAVNL